MSGRRQLPTGTVTFMFTDIEGSTRLVQALGDAWPELLAGHDRIVGAAIEEAGGVVVKTDGDAFFAVFQDPAGAVAACVNAQVELGSHAWPGGSPVRVRMGLHTGAGTLGGPDYVGLDVHRAARIAASAHGGQVVISEPTALLVERSLPAGVELRDLGKHRLKDLTEPEAIFQVMAPGVERDFPALHTLEATPNNLPLQVTSFVGREATLRQGLDLLSLTRLLTLTGPGGTGKTRLSLQIAAESAEDFPDGVFFVGLSPVTDPETVPSSILAALGERPSDRDRTPRETLLDHLTGRSMLLVLDNFEQLLPAATLVAEVLRVAPGSKVLVTSRAPLHISGEQEMPVPPLSLPGEGADAETGSEAVALFMERAMAVRPDFGIDESNRADVAALVRRLDGLPLAIELVASRVRLLPVAEILDRLDARMLASGSVDLPQRQRTIEGAIGWSYDLLESAQRRLFARFSVFAGGASLEEVEAVCGPGLALDPLDGISDLIDQSLLRVDPHPGVNRYRMLHVIREFAAVRLDESGEADEIRLRHLEAYTTMVEGLAAEFLGEHRRTAFDAVELDHDNIRAALEWGTGRQVDLTLRLVAATWRFWQTRGHLHEGQRLVESVLEHEGGEIRNRARALEAYGGILWWRGKIEECAVVYRHAVELQRRIGDPADLANALYNYSLAASFEEETENEAWVALDEAEAVFAELGDPNGLGNVEWARGNHTLQSGTLEESAVHFRRSAEHYQSAGNVFGLGWSLFELGGSHLRLGNPEAAWGFSRDGLELFSSHHDVSAIVLFLNLVAGVAQAAGDRDRALRLSGAFQGLRIKTGADIATAAVNEIEGLEFEALENLTGAEAIAYAEGKEMTVEDATVYALEWSYPGT